MTYFSRPHLLLHLFPNLFLVTRNQRWSHRTDLEKKIFAQNKIDFRIRYAGGATKLRIIIILTCNKLEYTSIILTDMSKSYKVYFYLQLKLFLF
jgi:hypothetical protein